MSSSGSLLPSSPILPPLPPLPLSDNAIYNTAEAAEDDDENFLITLTAFLRRRRRPMDDDRVDGALLRPFLCRKHQ